MEIERTCARDITPLSSILAFYNVAPDGFIVAEAEKKVVGFLIGGLSVLRDGSKAGHVLSLAINPAFHRIGIGRALIKHFSEACRRANARSLFLEVKKSNENARKFYSHLGFKELCVYPRYYRMRGYTEDAILMRRELV
jgi:ribosomal-protein-alanine acetyltransferase